MKINVHSGIGNRKLIIKLYNATVNTGSMNQEDCFITGKKLLLAAYELLDYSNEISDENMVELCELLDLLEQRNE